MKHAFERLWRFLFGDDIFVSYSRADGAVYAAGLANELSARGFACKLDQWGSQPGKEIPAPLRAALRRSSLLVLVASPAAAASEQVANEVVEFRRTGRAIIPIDIGSALRSASYWPHLEGLHISSDADEALTTGDPSPDVLNRIEKTHTFTRKDRRLRSATAATTAVLAVLVVAAVVAAFIASREAGKALDQQRLARSRQLIAEAELIRNQGKDPYAGSMAKALEAYDLYPTGEVDGILRYGLDRLPRLLADFEHPASVVDLKLHADAASLTTHCEDGQVRVWRVGEPAPIAVLPVAGAQRVLLGDDGRTIAVVRDRTAHAYRFSDRAFVEIGRIEHEEPIAHVAFNGNASRLAAGGGSKPIVTIAEVTGSKLEMVASIEPTLKGGLDDIKLSPDGSRIALASSWDDDDDDSHYPVAVWDVSSRSLVMETGGSRFAFNKDGSRIATSRQDTWWVDDVSAGVENTRVARVVEESTITDYAFAGSLIITASREARVRLYDLDNNAKELTGFEHDAPVDRVWMQPDEEFDSLITLSGETTVHRWQARQVAGNVRTYEALRIAHAAPVTGVSVRGRLLATASADRHARLWVKTGFGSDSGFEHNGPRSHRFTPDGRYLSINVGDGLAIWDFLTSRLETIPTDLFEDHAALLPGASRAVTWGYSAIPRIRDLTSHDVVAELGKKSGVVHAARDGEHIGVQSDVNQVTIWRDREKVRTLDCPAPVTGIHLSGRGRYVVVFHAKHPAGLFDVTSGAELARLGIVDPPDDDNFGGAQPLAFSPDETLVAVKEDSKVVLLHTATGRPARELSPADKLWSIAFSETGSTLLARHGGGYTTWDIGGKKGATVTAASHAALSPSGDRILVARDNASSELLDAATAAVLWTATDAEQARFIAFAGRTQPYVATAGDKTVAVRDVRTGSLLTSMEFDQDIEGVTFTPDGAALIVIREDGTDRIPIAVQGLVAEARARLEVLKRIGVRP